MFGLSADTIKCVCTFLHSTSCSSWRVTSKAADIVPRIACISPDEIALSDDVESLRFNLCRYNICKFYAKYLHLIDVSIDNGSCSVLEILFNKLEELEGIKHSDYSVNFSYAVRYGHIDSSVLVWKRMVRIEFEVLKHYIDDFGCMISRIQRPDLDALLESSPRTLALFSSIRSELKMSFYKSMLKPGVCVQVLERVLRLVPVRRPLDQQTITDEIVLCGYDATRFLIEKNFAFGELSLNRAVSSSDMDIVEILLENKVHPPDYILDVCVNFGTISIFRILLDNGARPRSRTFTHLTFNRTNRGVKFIRELVSRGFRVPQILRRRLC